jgi:hypothetical protein
MPASSICSGCRQVVPKTINGRCPGCEADHQRERDAERAELEPWRKLYTTREWARARGRALQRYGRRCAVLERGQRCPATTGLEVHHTVPLSELWEDLGDDWPAFVRAACDRSILVPVCRPHHDAVEALRRQARA